MNRTRFSRWSIALAAIMAVAVAGISVFLFNPTLQAERFRQACIADSKWRVQLFYDNSVCPVETVWGKYVQTWFSRGFDQPEEVETFAIGLVNDRGRSVRMFYIPSEHPDYEFVKKLRRNQKVKLTFSEECVILKEGWERHDEGYLRLALAQ